MKSILRYLKPHSCFISLQLFIKLVGTVIELFLPWMLSTILDVYAPIGDMKSIYALGGLMILCAAIALTTNIAANRMSTKLAGRVTKKLRHDLFTRISYLSSSQADSFSAPSLISRLTSDTYNVHQMIDHMQRLGVRAPILILGGVVVTFSLDPVMTLVLICTLPLLGFVVWLVSKRGVPLYTKAQVSLDALVRKVQESMSGVRVIKALSKGEYENALFDAANREVGKNEYRAGLLMAVTNPAMNLFLNVGLTLVIVVGAFRVNSGFTEPGKIIAFLSYFMIILNALMLISHLFVVYSKGASSAKRIVEVLNAKDELKMEAPSKGGTQSSTEDHIAFKNVTFSYNKVQDNICDISFSLRRGETLGIIGSTGSGKSTLLQLLLRFYDVDSGEICILGENIKNIDPQELHGRFGVVFQNDFLFADSIYENISFGRSIPLSKVENGARTSQADFVFEKGFGDTLATKGGNLSGGQRQRLLIARAIAAKPDILLLDDCSSALDYKTDAALRGALKRDFLDTTTIIVAQRVSAILSADKILVLDDGHAIGYGTHAELLNTCKSYREIYDIQMGEAV